MQVPVEVVATFTPLPPFLKGGERNSRVPRKWRNGTAPSVDKIKSGDKRPVVVVVVSPLEGVREWGGCVTVVCRVTRVITVARLLARTPSQKTERTFHFYTWLYLRALITRQVPIAKGISQRSFAYAYSSFSPTFLPPSLSVTTDNPSLCRAKLVVGTFRKREVYRAGKV